MDKIYEDKKTTILIVTHDDEIARHAKKQITIKDGKLKTLYE